MSRKISIKDKKRWLEMYEAGKTEVQIARAEKRDPRTITRGIDEAIKDKRLTNIEDDLIRNALVDHQEQLKKSLRDIASILEMPPYNLEMREEQEGFFAPIPLSGALAKHVFKEQIVLEVEVEKKLEWELLQEHLKQEKLWDYLKQWRKALVDYLWARWRLKLSIRSRLEEQGLKYSKDRIDTESDCFSLEIWEMMFKVLVNRTLGVTEGTNLAEGLVDGDDGFLRYLRKEVAHSKNSTECKEKVLSVSNSSLNSPEVSEVRRTHRELADLTRTARREVDELLALNMVIGRCRVCRRLGR